MKVEEIRTDAATTQHAADTKYFLQKTVFMQKKEQWLQTTIVMQNNTQSPNAGYHETMTACRKQMG